MIQDRDLINNYGGGIVNASLLNAIVRGINLLLSLGRSVGSMVRRTMAGRSCAL